MGAFRKMSREDIALALKNCGFSKGDSDQYLSMNQNEKLSMLEEKRNVILSSIHEEESKLSSLDYLRYRLIHSREEDEDGVS